MFSNSITVDSKIRTDIHNSSAAEDTLEKYMSKFFHFKSICCITTCYRSIMPFLTGPVFPFRFSMQIPWKIKKCQDHWPCKLAKH